MEEETKNGVQTESEDKKEEPKETINNSDHGKPVTKKENIVVEAKKAAEELRNANAEKKLLLDREEKLIERNEAIAALGGGSPAGSVVEKPKEETPQEYNQRLLRESAERRNPKA